MKPKVKTLACFSLLALTSAAFGGTITFSLLNDQKSVQNPVTITQGHIEYGSLAPNCSGGQIMNISGLQTSTTEKTSIQVDTSTVPAACWQSDKGVVFQLVINTVDGKNPTSAPCGTFLTALSPDENVAEQTPLKIYETTDGFVCHLGP